MKVCIPTMEKGGMDGELSDHFGSSPTFTVIDTETMDVKIVPNESDHFGGTGKPPEKINSTGAKVVICRGMGPKAMIMLRDFGIDVYIGSTGNVRNAFEMWSSGKLQKATFQNACQGHTHDHNCH
jgi:predicted Fe-Mo cluster-binding NifX family protein